MLHDGLVDMLYALLPVLAEAFGLTYAQVGMIRAANKAATASLQIPAGLLAERVGPVLLLVLGTVVAGIAFVGLSGADSFAWILTGFFLAGCGASVQHPLSSALITTAFVGDGRRAALGYYNTFGDIGKFSFMGAAVLAMALGTGWQFPMLMFGVLALLTAIGLWMAMAGLPTPKPVAAQAGDAPVAELGWGIKSPLGATSLGLIASFDSGSRSGFLTFVAFAMIEKGVAIEWAAVAVLITLFGGMCGKFACGLLAERVGIIKTIAITEVWTIAGIVGVVMLPSYAAFALLPILGIALNGTSSVIYGTVSELVDDRRHARAYGLIYTVGSMCGIVSPLVFGAIADGFGVNVALLCIAVAVCATLPLLPLLRAGLLATKAQAI